MHISPFYTINIIAFIIVIIIIIIIIRCKVPLIWGSLCCSMPCTDDDDDEDG